MLLIGITGMPGSGKSTIYEVAKKYNLPVVSMGDVVRYETKKRGLELTPENVGNTAINLRKEYGNEAIAVVCLKYIENNLKDKDIIIVEGIRSLYEVNYFRKHYPLVLIAIHSSPLTRFNRLVNRRREDDSTSWEVFVERDLRELNFSIGHAIALSDFVVINESSIENCINQLDNILKEILSNTEKYKKYNFIYEK
ncbi:AAA family ATPase [Methanocaldococcus sp.]|uniref:AAA family ATPase n=1 Tax=Methanocaldococcus sp. TaxID=2152917 RepID=UPI00262CDAE5|nr:AAA family ATPase [Methanocaldococcus sp.]MCQ6254511.1 flagellar hook-basal body complex protein FliE [Methanocaldococcus sp.]